MADQQIGQLLDTLGVTADLDDGDLVTDAHIVLKVVKADGGTTLIKATSEALDWVTSIGMLTAVLAIENGRYVNIAEDDD
ncbi:hypothetical protein AB0B51_33495 [Streptomyces griseus]|uniref:hypothetical protein n=1 Tax=Streptomyces TaxID=1883 RepID=UPI0004CB08E9|nr:MULTISPECIES: hypothetical protein [Streptomyces]